MAAEKATPESAQLHGHARPGHRLHADDGAAPRRAPDPADGLEEQREPRHRVRGLDRHPGAARRPARARSTARRPSGRSPIPSLQPEDIRMPGHVFPLMAQEGGVLQRAGHTEATVDLARLAGLYPAGVLCEVLHPDGSMARLPELARVAREHGLKIISIADLIEYRRHREQLVRADGRGADPDRARRVHRARPTRAPIDGMVHVALVLGEVGDGEQILVRVHSECLTGDVFGSLRCDCGDQLRRRASRQVGDGGPRRRPVHPGPRGPGDRADAQAPRLPAPGAGAGHGRGERRARVPGGPARLRDRRADPRRPRRALDAPAHEQPGEARRARGLRAVDRRARAARDASERGEHRATCGRSARSSATSSTTSTPRPPPRRRRAVEAERRRRGAVNEIRGDDQARGRRFAIVVARFNEIVDAPSSSTAPLDCLRAHGVAEEDVDVVWVPGAFELPLVARRLAASRDVRRRDLPRRRDPRRDRALRPRRRAGGGTGSARPPRRPGVPVIFGVLTTDTLEQAMDRAGGKHGNKGWDAAMAAMEMASAPRTAARRRADRDRRQALGQGRDLRAEPAELGPRDHRRAAARRRASTTTRCGTRCGWCSTPGSRSQIGNRPSRPTSGEEFMVSRRDHAPDREPRADAAAGCSRSPTGTRPRTTRCACRTTTAARSSPTGEPPRDAVRGPSSPR